MNAIRVFLQCAVSGALGAMLAGCESDTAGRVDRQKGTVVVRPEPTMISLAFDSRDYNELARKLYDSLAKEEDLVKGKVVAMGPVVVAPDEQIQIRFSSVTLHERLATLIQRARIFAFSEVVRASNVVKTDEEADRFVSQVRLKIQQLEFDKSQIDNPEEYALYGQLAKVDYMLVFRLSSNVQTGQKNYTEATYRLNYRLVDVKTGLRKWTDEVEYTKAK